MGRNYAELLERYFGFPSFRPGQLETIRTVIEDERDVLAILPTSTGKSLTFQMLTIMLRRQNAKHVTLVVSPLVALMQDQVRSWNERFVCDRDGQLRRRADSEAGDAAVLLGSAQPDSSAEQNAYDCKYAAVYVAPEKLPYLDAKMLRHVSLLIVDECHCVSEHGNSFRPAYRRIRQFVPNVRTVALTATACPDVCRDVATSLALQTHRVIRHSIYRPNLAIGVRVKRTKLLDTEYIRGELPTSGLTVIFCPTRAECDRVALALGVPAVAYHAGMSVDEREASSRKFRAGHVLVATNCFGLGVDIPNIRLVVHYGLPRSILGYVQEIGRAGRDGHPASCILLYRPSDVSRFCDTERDVKLASDMLAWVQSTQLCRYQTLVRALGEGTEVKCTRCDVCSSTVDVGHVPTSVCMEDIVLLLRAIAETGDYAGQRLPCEYLLGRRSKRVLRFARAADGVYGSGTHHSLQRWQRIHAYLVQQSLAQGRTTSRGFVVYSLSPAGQDVLANA